MNDKAMRDVFRDLPMLTAGRTVLKKVEMKDAWDLYAYASLDDTSKYLLWSPHLNIDESRGQIEWLQHRYKRGMYADWGVYHRETLKLIGTVGFASVDAPNDRAELGYVLSPQYQGRGYMGEAVERVLSLAFCHLELNRVELRIMHGNVRSAHFAESHGFKYEGLCRQELLVKGEYRDILHYALLKDEYHSQRQQKV